MEAPLPQDLSVPTYIPLDVDGLREVSTLSSSDDGTKEIEKTIVKISEEAKAFIEFILEEDLTRDLSPVITALKTHEETLNDLVQLKHKHELLTKAIGKTKLKFQTQMHTEEDFSLASLSYFRLVEIPEFADAVTQELNGDQQDEDSYTAPDPRYTHVRNALLILQNPEDPLPEDNDDEIEVAGGKVSLKDPITLNLFEKPVKSKKCGHVFESLSIDNHLRTLGAMCPISGCSKTLVRSDLVPDDLMTLRVLAYQCRPRSSESYDTL